MASLQPTIELGTQNKRFKASLPRLILLFLLGTGVILCGSYIVYTPALQLYWGTTSRLKPIFSKGPSSGGIDIAEDDLTKQAIASNGNDDQPRPPPENDNDKNAAVVQEEVEQGLEEEEKEDFQEEIKEEEEEEEEEEVKQLEGQPLGTDDKEAKTKANKNESALALTHRLTKEIAIKASTLPNGTQVPVLVTWANFHYRDFVLNWYEHLNATGCTNVLIGAMDDALLEVLVNSSIPTFAMSSGLTLGDFGWGTNSFHKMGREKISLIQTFTTFGVSVLISDVDTVWIRDPTEYMERYPEADVLTSSDHLAASSKDGSLEAPQDAANSAANIGIMLFRPSAKPLAAEWVAMLEKDDKIWDQNAFNELMRRGWDVDDPQRVQRPDKLFTGYDGKLKFGVLPISTFCSGHTYFIQRLPETLGLEPYVVHATFQYSGTVGKRNRFRERLLFNDPPEYFQHDTGFISVHNEVPAALKIAVETVKHDMSLESTVPHFDLVNPQLTLLRALFALATITGRAAVLPQLWCGFDRWWAPHAGWIPGGEFPIPFECPSDHVLDLEIMGTNRYTEAEFGPNIDWRESSFLRNPRTPREYNTTRRLVIKTCSSTKDGADNTIEAMPCSDGTSPAPVVEVAVGTATKETQATVYLLADRNEKQLQTALAGKEHAKYAVFHFEDAKALWGGFTDGGVKFKKRMDTYLSIWCCVEGNPGHIWYDMFWDTGAHKDRWGREIEATWKPQLGP